ncbi:Topoisomerase 1-associated factor 1 [Blastocladiella emersonii ATCC 22665]|nr:Topoisomerase 1-associated factor 1 [Blastocladiella emersonii ATCC 22665]
MDYEALETHIFSLCSAVGGFEDTPAPDGSVVQHYVLGDEALDCLRDLKRFLRYDEANKEKTVAALLGKFALVQANLVPILEHHAGSSQLVFFAAIELLVPLTWPLTADELGTDLLAHHRAYKRALVTESRAVDVVFDHLVLLLSEPFAKRSDRTNAIIRLILYLFRNLLAIPDPPAGVNTTTDTFHLARMQERLLVKYHDLDVFAFLITAASNIADREFATWNTILVEIFFLVFASCSPKALTTPHKEHSADLVDELLAREAAKAVKPRRRHSRLAGSYTVRQGDGTQIVVHSLDKTIDAIDKSKQKNRVRSKFKKDAGPTTAVAHALAPAFKPKPLPDEGAVRVLRATADHFLSSCFDVLVAATKRDIDAERSHVRDEDPIHLLYLVGFFLEYQRLTSATHPLNLLASVVNVHGLLFLFKNMRDAADNAQPSRLHMAVDCTRHFLLTLQDVRAADDPDVRDVAANVLDNLYYEKAHLDMLVGLIKHFKNQSRRHLVALADLTHLLLKLMDAHAKASGKSALTVRAAKRGRNGAAKRAGGKSGEAEEEEDQIARDVVDDTPDSGAAAQYVERSLSFARIEAMFATDAVLDKYMLLLGMHASLAPATLHAVAKMLYRIAVKCDMPALFFQLDYLVQIHGILGDPVVARAVTRARSRAANPRPEDAHYRDLVGVLRVVAGKFFDATDKYPLLLVEVFFPHSKGDADRLLTGAPAAPKPKRGAGGEPRGPKQWDPDVELEVRPGFSPKMQIQIATSALLARGEAGAAGADGETAEPGEEVGVVLDRVLTTLSALASMRKGIPPLVNPDDNSDDDDDAVRAWPPAALAVPPADLDIKELRLLLKLTGMVVEDLAGITTVTAPGSVTGADLEDIVQWILDARANPVSHEGKNAVKLLKAKRPRKPRSRRAPRSDSDDEDEGEDEERPRKKKKRVPAKAASAKSAAFIYDSDEMLDDVDDTEFYARERERRDKTKAMHEALVGAQSAPEPAKKTAAASKPVAPAKKKKAMTRKARATVESSSGSDSDDDEEAETDADAAAPTTASAAFLAQRRPRLPRRRVATASSDSSSDDDAESAPVTTSAPAPAPADLADLDDDPEDEFSKRMAALRAETGTRALSGVSRRFFNDPDSSDDEESDDDGGGGASGSGVVTPPSFATTTATASSAAAATAGGGVADRLAAVRGIKPVALRGADAWAGKPAATTVGEEEEEVDVRPTKRARVTDGEDESEEAAMDVDE